MAIFSLNIVVFILKFLMKNSLKMIVFSQIAMRFSLHFQFFKFNEIHLIAWSCDEVNFIKCHSIDHCMMLMRMCWCAMWCVTCCWRWCMIIIHDDEMWQSCRQMMMTPMTINAMTKTTQQPQCQHPLCCCHQIIVVWQTFNNTITSWNQHHHGW